MRLRLGSIHEIPHFDVVLSNGFSGDDVDVRGTALVVAAADLLHVLGQVQVDAEQAAWSGACVRGGFTFWRALRFSSSRFKTRSTSVRQNSFRWGSIHASDSWPVGAARFLR